MKKGALVEFMSAFTMSVPNVIIFQYNPETLRHTLSQATAAQAAGSKTGSSPLAVAGPPSESFSFSLSMDVTDEIASQQVGIYPRLAALETLLHPVAGAPAVGSQSAATPAQLPTVLFVWGTGRILPVRLDSLTITEKLYDEELNPTHAEAQLELRVLTPSELESLSGPLAGLAKAAYTYSQRLREGLAVANLGNAARAVIGMLGDAHIPLG